MGQARPLSRPHSGQPTPFRALRRALRELLHSASPRDRHVRLSPHLGFPVPGCLAGISRSNPQVDSCSTRRFVREHTPVRVNPSRGEVRFSQSVFSQKKPLRDSNSESLLRGLNSVLTILRAGALTARPIDATRVIAAKDQEQAFLQAHSFVEAKDGKRYCVWQPYRGAPLCVFQQLGPI